MIVVLSYLVVSVFLTVYETTIDTIFLCFLVDEEVNGASQQMLASKNLRKIVGKYSSKKLESDADYHPGTGLEGQTKAVRG